jgi:hypothetical protein
LQIFSGKVPFAEEQAPVKAALDQKEAEQLAGLPF